MPAEAGVWAWPYHSVRFSPLSNHHLNFKAIDVDLPSVTLTQGLAINDEGDIVGRYQVGSVGQGFLLSDGTLQRSTTQAASAALLRLMELTRRVLSSDSIRITAQSSAATPFEPAPIFGCVRQLYRD